MLGRDRAGWKSSTWPALEEQRPTGIRQQLATDAEDADQTVAQFVPSHKGGLAGYISELLLGAGSNCAKPRCDRSARASRASQVEAARAAGRHAGAAVPLPDHARQPALQGAAGTARGAGVAAQDA